LEFKHNYYSFGYFPIWWQTRSRIGKVCQGVANCYMNLTSDFLQKCKNQNIDFCKFTQEYSLFINMVKM